MYNGMMIKNTANNNNSINNSKEEIKMDELKMYEGLKYCKDQGATIKFFESKIPFGAKLGIGVEVNGERLPVTPFIAEFISNLKEFGEKDQKEAAMYTRFVKNCFELNNHPVAIILDKMCNEIFPIHKKYFLCDNGVIINNEGVPICESDHYIYYLLRNISIAKENDDDIRALAFTDAFEEYVKYCHNKEDDNSKKNYCELKDEYLEEKREEEEETNNCPDIYLDPELEEWTIHYLSKKIKETHDFTALLKLDVIKALLSEAKQGNPTSIKELKSLREEVENDWNNF